MGSPPFCEDVAKSRFAAVRWQFTKIAMQQPEEDDTEQVRPVRKEDEEDIDYLNYENYPDDDSREWESSEKT